MPPGRSEARGRGQVDREGPARGSWAAEALRSSPGVPVGRGRGARPTPTLDWMRTAVHLSKGCCRGRRPWRVHNLGRPPRRLTSWTWRRLPARLRRRGRAVELCGAGRRW
ncbi:hypothetical protein QJS66_20100 [Kocuria rhizophila]|nr:hypothetical protein QJS66_20100 [Kocuria rhizophila]